MKILITRRIGPWLSNLGLVLFGYGWGAGWWGWWAIFVWLLGTFGLAWIDVTRAEARTTHRATYRPARPAGPIRPAGGYVEYSHADLPVDVYVVDPTTGDVRQPRMRPNPQWRNR